jgi:Bacterial toxin homologue of phage lysozyme, C-term
VTARIIDTYNQHSKFDFRRLPSAMQTVIASVGYQNGPSFEETPRFFKAATAGDIAAMLKELRSFGDPYPSRRNLEADYLERNLPRPKLKPRLLP